MWKNDPVDEFLALQQEAWGVFRLIDSFSGSAGRIRITGRLRTNSWARGSVLGRVGQENVFKSVHRA